MPRHSSGARSVRMRLAASAIAAVATTALGASPVHAAAKPKPNGGAEAGLTAISCTGARTCAAVGSMNTPAQAKPPGQNLVFVVSEVNGTWGKAKQIPGLAALQGKDTSSWVPALSCSSAGNCSAGGSYVDPAGRAQAFVVSERNGVWGNAEEVPGLAAMNVDGHAILEQMSCTLADGCLAAGIYESLAGQQAFVVQEVGGVWGSAEDIAGLDALNTGGSADVKTLYCVHTGNCTVGGDYNDSAGAQPFVAYQNYGEWYDAQTFPDVTAANTGRNASIDSLSCARRGICTAVGSYQSADGSNHVFSDSESSYIWNGFQPIPGMAALPTGGGLDATIGKLTCVSTGNCVAGGHYTDPAGQTQAYLVTEASGVWNNAQTLPGLAAIKPIHTPLIAGLACRSTGNCTVVGSYSANPKAAGGRAFVLTETSGTWGKAEALPGELALSTSEIIEPEALSCGAAGDCTAGGVYVTHGNRLALFLATQKNGVWGNAQRVPGTGP